MTHATFRARVEALMPDAGLKNWHQLSRKTGIPRQSMAHYRDGDRQLPADAALKIAQALNTTVEFLLTGEEIS